jgi:hypothetical protein
LAIVIETVAWFRETWSIHGSSGLAVLPLRYAIAELM